MSKTLGIVLVLQYRWVKNWYWNWNWYCIRAFWWSGIGIGIVYTGFKELVCLGIGIGIVYTMSEKLVLELELFNLRLKNWYELALELELFKQWLKNWYWYWNCLHKGWKIGIGTGIVYTVSEELVLYCILFSSFFFMGVGVLVLDNTWSYNNNNDNNNVCIFIHQTLMTMPNRDLYCLAPS